MYSSFEDSIAVAFPRVLTEEGGVTSLKVLNVYNTHRLDVVKIYGEPIKEEPEEQAVQLIFVQFVQLSFS